QNCSPIAPTPDQSAILRSEKSCPTSKPKSSDAPIVPKGSCHYPSVGLSNVRSLGRTVAADWPRIGRISIAALSLSSNSLPSASCCESSAILDEVPGRTLRSSRDHALHLTLHLVGTLLICWAAVSPVRAAEAAMCRELERRF